MAQLERGEDLMREVTPESEYTIENSEGERIGGNVEPVTHGALLKRKH